MSSPTILICEDEPILRELMRVSLGDRYSFAEAADVAEAIELEASLRTLVERAPELALREEPVRVPAFVIRGFQRVEVGIRRGK